MERRGKVYYMKEDGEKLKFLSRDEAEKEAMWQKIRKELEKGNPNIEKERKEKARSGKNRGKINGKRR